MMHPIPEDHENDVLFNEKWELIAALTESNITLKVAIQYLSPANPQIMKLVSDAISANLKLLGEK